MARPEVTGRRAGTNIDHAEADREPGKPSDGDAEDIEPPLRRTIHASAYVTKYQQARGPPDDVDAYSLDEFCRRHGISRPFFYKLRHAGLGPDEMRLGCRVLITKESAARWRAERTAA